MRRGFTIVELLIVIVVIGILAAISFVAYNGIQKRAYNAQTLSTVRTYQSALAAYYVENGQYPAVPGAVCLGQNYEDVNSDGVGDCGELNTNEMVHENAAFNQQLRSVITSLPMAITKRTKSTFSGQPWVGITLTHWSEFMVNGKSAPYFIKYVLEGSNESCGAGVVGVRPGGAYPDMITDAVKNTWWDAQSTTCLVSVGGV